MPFVIHVIEQKPSPTSFKPPVCPEDDS